MNNMGMFAHTSDVATASSVQEQVHMQVRSASEYDYTSTTLTRPFVRPRLRRSWTLACLCITGLLRVLLVMRSCMQATLEG